MSAWVRVCGAQSLSQTQHHLRRFEDTKTCFMGNTISFTNISYPALLPEYALNCSWIGEVIQAFGSWFRNYSAQLDSGTNTESTIQDYQGTDYLSLFLLMLLLCYFYVWFLKRWKTEWIRPLSVQFHTERESTVIFWVMDYEINLVDSRLCSANPVLPHEILNHQHLSLSLCSISNFLHIFHSFSSLTATVKCVQIHFMSPWKNKSSSTTPSCWQLPW